MSHVCIQYPTRSEEKSEVAGIGWEDTNAGFRLVVDFELEESESYICDLVEPLAFVLGYSYNS